MIDQEEEDLYLSTPLTKDDMIHELVNAEYQAITDNPEGRDSWIWDTLQYGTVGYQNMSEATLKALYDDRIKRKSIWMGGFEIEEDKE